MVWFWGLVNGGCAVDITDIESANAWMAKQTPQIQLWFASRCALRNLPSLKNPDNSKDKAIVDQFVLAVFRANLLASVASTLPEAKWLDLREQSQSVAEFCRHAENGADSVALLGNSQDDLIETAQNLANFILSTTEGSVNRNPKRKPHLQHQLFSNNLRGYFGFPELVEQANRDANEPLVWPPLWHAHPIPDDLEKLWERLATALENSPREWEFWHRWYKGILVGEPLDWGLQRDVAQIPGEDWEQGPAHVAKLIAGIREKHRLKARIAELEEALEVASNSRFGVGGNNPPEPIENAPEISRELIFILAPLQELKAETEAEVPDRRRIGKAVETLQKILMSCTRWAGKKLDHGVTAAFVTAGAAGGKDLWDWIAANSDKIAKVIEAAKAWLPFVP